MLKLWRLLIGRFGLSVQTDTLGAGKARTYTDGPRPVKRVQSRVEHTSSLTLRDLDKLAVCAALSLWGTGTV